MDRYGERKLAFGAYDLGYCPPILNAISMLNFK